jgi:biotin operon repressor
MIIKNTPEALAQCFKVLADESRLRMIAYLGNQERNVSELAALLDLSEPTVSHHLARLREAGLVNLRASGNQRFYRLDRETLQRLTQRVSQLDHIETAPKATAADQSWIDELDLDDEERKVLRDYTRNRRLTQIPVKRHKLLVVLRWLAGYFQSDVKYTEREVNAIIGQYHEDYASLRRELIDFGFLRRERGGGAYWVTPDDEG